MTYAYLDTFDRADGALGDDWTTYLGSWAIVSGQARKGNLHVGLVGYLPAGTFADGIVGSTTFPDRGGVILRAQDAQNMYVAYTLIAGGKQYVSLAKVVGGSWTSLWTSGIVASPVALSVEMGGTSFEFFNGATSLGTHSDATYASGYAGMMGGDYAYTVFPDFFIDPYPSASGTAESVSGAQGSATTFQPVLPQRMRHIWLASPDGGARGILRNGR